MLCLPKRVLGDVYVRGGALDAASEPPQAHCSLGSSKRRESPVIRGAAGVRFGHPTRPYAYILYGGVRNDASAYAPGGTCDNSRSLVPYIEPSNHTLRISKIMQTHSHIYTRNAHTKLKGINSLPTPLPTSPLVSYPPTSLSKLCPKLIS